MGVHDHLKNGKKQLANDPLQSTSEPPQRYKQRGMVDTFDEAQELIDKRLEDKNNKVRFEDTHSRVSILLQNDLKERLDRVAARKKAEKVRGFKTEFFNQAIDQLLRRYE